MNDQLNMARRGGDNPDDEDDKAGYSIPVVDVITRRGGDNPDDEDDKAGFSQSV